MTDNTAPVKEIQIPVADPNDPYAVPAAMPSSVDHAVRSFNASDYPEPNRKQDEWRYTPIERINEFFTVFKPSGETQIEVSMIDGSPPRRRHQAYPGQDGRRPVRYCLQAE